MKNTQAKKQKKSQGKVTDGRVNNSAPSKLTDENRIKLKESAALDASVEEMAYYCGVSKQTIYNWFKEDTDLFDEIERLRQKPILKARQTVAMKLGESYQNAMDYLKRKRRDEFGDQEKHDVDVVLKIDV